MERSIAKAVTDLEARPGLYEDVCNVTELGGLGGGLCENCSALRILHIQFNTRIVSKEGLEEILITKAAHFPQPQLQRTQRGIHNLDRKR